jgi:hypothetical protein
MRQELPGFAVLHAPPPALAIGGLEAMGHAVVDALTSLSTAQARPAQASVTTPADFYGSNLGVLLRLQQVEHQGQLPRVFIDLARSAKSQQIGTVTNNFGLVATRLKVPPPMVSKKVVDFFVQLKFQFTDPNCATAG